VNFTKSTLVSILAVLMIAMPSQQLYAQPAAATTTIALSYTVGESLTLSASPASTNLLNNGQYGTPVTLTSGWNLSTSSTLELDAYFASASAALTGPVNVPSSKIYDQVTSSLAGGSSGSCGMTITGPPVAIGPGGSACPTLFKVPGTVGQGTDSSTTIAFSIDNSIVAAGTYTGTVNLILQAY
jgi:hypothetical protein